MRKLLLAAVTVFFIASCGKEDNDPCYQCRRIGFHVENGVAVNDTTTTKVCGKNDEEIKQYETSTTITIDGITRDVTTNCTKE